MDLKQTKNRRVKTYQPTTDDKLDKSLLANTIIAKLIIHFQVMGQISNTIWLTDKHYSLDSEDYLLCKQHL